MYCGDGINDLMALAAADVGMAIGHSHASAAAALCDTRSSVEGVYAHILMQSQAASRSRGYCYDA